MRLNLQVYLYCFVIFGSCFLGCGKTDENQSRSDDLSQVVFAVVNGKQLTAKTVRDATLVSAKIAELSGRPIQPKLFPTWGNRFAMQSVPSLISSQLLEDEVDRRGIQASDESRTNAVNRYGRMMKKKFASENELFDSFGELRPFFCEQFERECKFSTFFKQEKFSEIIPHDIDVYYLTTSNRITWAKMTNERARARAKEVYAKLKAGGDWTLLAKEYTEDAVDGEEREKYAEEWDSFSPDSYIFPEVGQAVKGLKAGQFSEPVETDDGLLIVRVNSIEDGICTCSRIRLRMAADVEIVPPHRVEAYLKQRKLRERQRDLLRELRAAATIEYPLGTNFTYRIWEMPKRPARKADESRKERRSERPK